MTIFLGYAHVGNNSNVFKPKKITNKNGQQGKDVLDKAEHSVYPTLIFSSDVDPDIITNQVTHKFCQAGGFNFRKKQLQCMKTCTPLIMYYLYTFNDLATILLLLATTQVIMVLASSLHRLYPQHSLPLPCCCPCGHSILLCLWRFITIASSALSCFNLVKIEDCYCCGVLPSSATPLLIIITTTAF